MTSKQLIEKGWAKDPKEDKHCWLNPIFGYKKYGTTIEKASAEQEKHDILAAGEWFYWVQELKLGGFSYGWVAKRQQGLGADKIIQNLMLSDTKDAASYELAKNRENLSAKSLLSFSYEYYHYLLKFEEKHGGYHYYVPSPAHYLLTCLEVALERIGGGCWYPTAEDIKVGPRPKFSKEKISRWEEGELKRAALNEWINFEYSIKSNKEDIETIELIKVIKNHKKDKESAAIAAAKLLWDRRDAEYEAMQCVVLKVIKVD